jgi:hypothetical protein
MTERQTKEQRAADEALRRTNPLQIMCAECFRLCVLSKDGKRWLCQHGHGNERVQEPPQIVE